MSLVVDGEWWRMFMDGIGSGGWADVVGGADVIGLVDVVGDGGWQIWPHVTMWLNFNCRG
jgi:hypothetical protein